MKNYYHILGLSKTAKKAEIKVAYRNLAKRFHPDRNDGSEEAEAKFKEVVEAYGVLSDTFKRAAYERSIVSAAKKEQKHTTHPSASQNQPKPNGYKQSKEILNRFYLSIFPKAAKASLILIAYGLFFSVDLFLPYKSSTEFIKQLINVSTENKQVRLLSQGPNAGIYYSDAGKNDITTSIDVLVKLDKHIFFTDTEVCRLSNEVALNVKSSLIFNTVNTITIEGLNKSIRVKSMFLMTQYLSIVIWILGLLVVYLGLNTKFSLDIVMLLFLINCSLVFISLIFLFIHILLLSSS